MRNNTIITMLKKTTVMLKKTTVIAMIMNNS